MVIDKPALILSKQWTSWTERKGTGIVMKNSVKTGGQRGENWKLKNQRPSRESRTQSKAKQQTGKLTDAELLMKATNETATPGGARKRPFIEANSPAPRGTVMSFRQLLKVWYCSEILRFTKTDPSRVSFSTTPSSYISFCFT
jgi:hypothetical protein